MQLIFMRNDTPRVTSISLSWLHLALALLLVLGASIALAGGVVYWAVRHPNHIPIPLVRTLLEGTQTDQSRAQQAQTRDNLDAMAQKLGTMQAQLMRLDALGERVVEQTGVKQEDLKAQPAPARGGPVPAGLSRDISEAELQQEIHRVARQIDDRLDQMTFLESVALLNRLKRNQAPSLAPLNSGWNSSSYGWRFDPFNGKQTFHEGIDFVAPVGTPIRAAASGKVLLSEYHAQYGNMVEIDHGNGLITRYAHASKLLVAEGQVVQAGQIIAQVGSTGRSTGSHLHFEVRYKGVAQNPARFIEGAEG